MENTFLQLAVALSLSSIFGYFVLKLKLPLVIAYLLAGVSLSLVSLIDPSQSEVFEILPEIGIAFVLFLIGMELDLREIKALGKPIVVSALGQVTISTLAGFTLSSILGFGQVESVFMGIGLAFSSTVVVVKMLLEKRDLASLYGKLSIGILLVEDVIAIGVLILIAMSESVSNWGLEQAIPILFLIVKALGLFLLTFILSRYVLERIFDYVAKSVELLFLSALTWCFVFTSIAVYTGFSVVIGAFLAGVALASSPYHLQIQGKVKPLRDFFLTLFFIFLGLQANVTEVIHSFPVILIFTFVAVVFKPLVYLLFLSLFGFRKHTFFQTALNLSQVSEFSLVVLLIGMQSGVTSEKGLSIMAAVAVLSILISSVLIAYSRQLYKILALFLAFFEHKKLVHVVETKLEAELNEHIVIVGAHRVGGPVVKYLKKSDIPFVVMDFNPHIIQELRENNVKVVYGDVGDPEVLDSLQLEKAKLIICTATDMTDNEMLLEECQRRNVSATVVARALDEHNAQILKDMGANYVIMPEQVSGDFLVNQLKNHWPNVHFHGLDRY